MTVKMKLTVNGAPIPTDYFVEGFIDHVVSGIIEALEDTGKIKDLSLSIEAGKATVNLNGKIVAINDFVNEIVTATILGMLSSLKGVKNIKKVSIDLHK
jgi:hypothetical protein